MDTTKKIKKVSKSEASPRAVNETIVLSLEVLKNIRRAKQLYKSR